MLIRDRANLFRRVFALDDDFKIARRKSDWCVLIVHHADSPSVTTSHMHEKPGVHLQYFRYVTILDSQGVTVTSDLAESDYAVFALGSFARREPAKAPKEHIALAVEFRYRRLTFSHFLSSFSLNSSLPVLRLRVRSWAGSSAGQLRLFTAVHPGQQALDARDGVARHPARPAASAEAATPHDQGGGMSD
jgi:hypothetical protein